nr:hypothetical protein [Bacteroidota bacterium]
MWVDSSSFNNQTNSYYLNRNLEDSMDVNFCGLCYCKTNQPGFLQHICVIPPNGNVAFYFPDTFYINIYDSVGASWVYDYYPTTITAQIISATFDSIFDTMDSVKTILLSTNDTIRISKKFGILCFPKGPSPFEYYRLKGIDGAVDQDYKFQSFTWSTLI